jgi:hypothetical protein
LVKTRSCDIYDEITVEEILGKFELWHYAKLWLPETILKPTLPFKGCVSTSPTDGIGNIFNDPLEIAPTRDFQINTGRLWKFAHRKIPKHIPVLMFKGYEFTTSSRKRRQYFGEILKTGPRVWLCRYSVSPA